MELDQHRAGWTRGRGLRLQVECLSTSILLGRATPRGIVPTEDAEDGELPAGSDDDEEPGEEQGYHEKRKEVIEYAKKSRSFLLCIVAPVAPFRISPTRAMYATLGFPEEHFVQEFVRHVALSKIPRERRVLHLLLHSPGGLESSSFAIAKCLRRNFGRVITYVPHIAASGATVIALPSDEIVMGEISRLSPIDVQIYDGPSARSALSVIRGVSLMNKRYARTREEDIAFPDKALIRSVDLATWDEMRCSLLSVQRYATQLLKLGGFEEPKAKGIAKELVYGYPTHDTVIDSEEVLRLGLRAVDASQRRREWQMMSAWYGDYLFTESPYHHVKFALPRTLSTTRSNGGK